MELELERIISLIKDYDEFLDNNKDFKRDYHPLKSKELFIGLELLNDHIFWQSRNYYLEIIELFMNQKINKREYLSEFCSRRRKDMDELDMLIQNLKSQQNSKMKLHISWNPECARFSGVISCLFHANEEMDYMDDSDLRTALEREGYLSTIGLYCE